MAAKREISGKLLILFVAVAFAGFYVVFQTGFLNFWWRMLIVSWGLWLLGRFDHEDTAFAVNVKELLILIGVSVGMYFLFFLLNIVAHLFPWLTGEVTSVYTLSYGMKTWQIALFLAFIGVADESFWRGFVAKGYFERFKPWTAILLSGLTYGMLHVFTGNLSLMFAALTLGLIWSYMYYKTKNIAVSMYSHIIWDVMIFAVFPLK